MKLTWLGMGLTGAALALACGEEFKPASPGTGGTAGGAGQQTGGQPAGGASGADSGTSGAPNTGGADAGSSDGSAGDSSTGGAPPWTPDKIPNCVLWLDARDTSTLTLDGSAVTQWKSKCGSTTVTSTPPQAPKTVQVSGKPAIQCDGVDDKFDLKGTAIDANSYVLFFVARKRFLFEEEALWSNRAGATPPSGTVTMFGFQSRLVVWHNSVVPPGFNTDNPVAQDATLIAELAVSPAARELGIDGTTWSQALTGTGTYLGTGTICADKSNYGAFDLFEIIMYDRMLTNTERAKIRAELKATWGTP
ncbi:MAG: hypothetical protein R3B13_22915 [Polyangiaceae bacterium]